MKFRCLAALFLPLCVFAQTPAVPPVVPDASGNLLKNPRFEQFTPDENLWDGVDDSGFLAGDTGASEPTNYSFFGFSRTVDAILDGGNTGRLQMALSVQVADLNNDGLLDLLTVDGAGYFRVYFNHGSRAEPKFDHCELVPLFLGRVKWNIGLKVCLADFNRDGSSDMVIGNYLGNLLMVRNTGGSTSPEWRQPKSMDEITISTTKDGSLWANLLAPAVYDWNRDGKLDVLVGEGSYSANAVHLLLNQGNNSAPKFTEDARDYIAYGDGREQLVPVVVDYNGDGFPDLLVGDRTGNINVYLSAGLWTKGVELKRQKDPISFGGLSSVGSGSTGTRCVYPAVADLNGDGLFDIIVGKPNGRIAVSYNIGTKTEPKFGPLVELKGEDIWKKGSARTVKEWTTYFGYRTGNICDYTTTVSSKEDPEVGSSSPYVLKFGYVPSQNKVIRTAPMILPSAELNAKNEYVPTNIGFTGNRAAWSWDLAERWGMNTDSNFAILRQNVDVGLLKPNTNYKLTFKVKGNGVKKATVTFAFAGWLFRDFAKAGTPASAPDNTVCEAVQQSVDFPVTSNWTTVSKTFNFKFAKNKDLDAADKWNGGVSKIEYRGIIDIRAALNPSDGTLYFDEVLLTP